MPGNGEITSLNLKIKNDTSDAIKGIDKLISKVEKLQTALSKVSLNGSISVSGSVASPKGGSKSGGKSDALKETKRQLVEITNQFDLMKKKAGFLSTLGQGGSLDKAAKEERRRVNYALQYLATIERINKMQENAKVGVTATSYLNASKTDLLEARARQTEAAIGVAVNSGEYERANTLALQYLSIQERIESIKTAAEKKTEAERVATEKAALAAQKKAQAEEAAKQKAEEYARAQKEAARATRLASITDFFKGVGSAVVKRITEPFKKAHQAISKFFSSVGRIAFYRLIRSMIKSLTQGFSEGVKNLYAWSEAFNTKFAPTMDMFKTQMTYLKNGFASMFSPLIEWVVPNVIVPLTDALVELFNYIQQGFAILVGHDYWYKAQKSMQKFGEATGKANIQLAKFDEINNLTENGSGSNEDASGMFTLEKVATGAKFSFFENLRKAIKDGDWEGVGGVIADGFNYIFVDYLDPGKTGGLADKIIGFINAAIDIAAGFNGKLNWSGIGDNIGTFLEKMFTDVKWDRLGYAIGALARGLAKLVKAAFSKIDLETVANATEDFFAGLIDGVTGMNVSGTIQGSRKIEEVLTSLGYAPDLVKQAAVTLYAQFDEQLTSGATITIEDVKRAAKAAGLSRFLGAEGEQAILECIQKMQQGAPKAATVVETLNAPFDRVSQHAKDKFGDITTSANNVFNKVDGNGITAKGQTLFGNNFVGGATTGINNGKNTVATAITGLASNTNGNAITNTGNTLFGQNLIGGAVTGINNGKGQVTTAINGLTSGTNGTGAGQTWATQYLNGVSQVLGSSKVSSSTGSGGTTRFQMIKDARGGFMTFANGGLFSQGTMYVAGEVPGQAEMVGNINGRTGVASGFEITGIRDAVLNTGEAEVALLNRLLTALERKQLTISPSAQLGRVVAQSNRMYGTVTG